MKDEGIVSDDAIVPKQILHRHTQRKELKRCLDNKSAEHVFLIGPPGTGKTSLSKWILGKHFQETSVYVNCWNHRSTHEVLMQILIGIGEVVHGRESTGELADKLEKVLSQRRIVVVLDEIDKLKDPDILYTLSRNGCGLVLISNRHDALVNMNSRIASSLPLTQIEFPAYADDEMFDILKDRVESSLKPMTFEDELIRVASSVSRGDARIGIQTLIRAGRYAEQKKHKRVTVEHVRKVVEQRKELNQTFPLFQLSEDQKIIYEILGKRGKMPSGEIYKQYCQTVKGPVGERAYRQWMRKFVRLGLMKEKGYGRWKEYEIVG